MEMDEKKKTSGNCKTKHSKHSHLTVYINLVSGFALLRIRKAYDNYQVARLGEMILLQKLHCKAGKTNMLEEIKRIEESAFISDIVKNDYRTAGVFKKHGIDFCCGGKFPLEAICASKDLDTKEVVRELEAATPGNRISSWII